MLSKISFFFNHWRLIPVVVVVVVVSSKAMTDQRNDRRSDIVKSLPAENFSWRSSFSIIGALFFF